MPDDTGVPFDMAKGEPVEGLDIKKALADGIAEARRKTPDAKVCSVHILNEFEKSAIRDNGKDPDDYVAVNLQPLGPEGVTFVDMGTHYIMVVQAPIAKRMFPAMQKPRILLADGSQRVHDAMTKHMGAIPSIRVVQALSAIDYEYRKILKRLRDGEGKHPFDAGLEDAEGNSINREPERLRDTYEPEDSPPPPPPPPRVALKLPEDILEAAARAHAIPRPFFDALLGNGLGSGIGTPEPALPEDVDFAEDSQEETTGALPFRPTKES